MNPALLERTKPHPVVRRPAGRVDRRGVEPDRIRSRATAPASPKPATAAPPQGRRALRRECEEIAVALAATTDPGERIELYRRSGVAKLARAAALRPELMPLLNGEFEWLTLTMADTAP